MDRSMTCAEWALTLGAILVVFVMTSLFVLASVGIAPVIDANGLSFDATGYVTHEANRTVRYVAEQHEQTEGWRPPSASVRLCRRGHRAAASRPPEPLRRISTTGSCRSAR